jgi:hypothetical protein
MHYLHGNPAPYFSVTCDIEHKRTPNGRWVEGGGGAAHETILDMFPKLDVVVPLHLCDPDGVPMHAIENGLFHLGLTKHSEGPKLDVVARHFRITEHDAYVLAAHLSHHNDKRAALTRYVDQNFRARWKAEADAAIARLDELAAAEGAENVAE